MVERVAVQLAITLLKRKEVRSGIKTFAGVMAIGIIVLLLFPLILLCVPLVLLNAALSSVTTPGIELARNAQQQIALVERYCAAATGNELDQWIESNMANLTAAGIPESRVSISLPSESELRIKASEIIILWSAEHYDMPIDDRVRDVVNAYISKEVITYSIVMDGLTQRYADITVWLRTFGEVLQSSGLTANQQSRAWMMYEFAEANAQLQVGVWLGNDQLYTAGDRTFNDGQIPVSYYHQRDTRWANKSYAGESIGIAGCGPTSVAIVCSSLTGSRITPQEVASWSQDNGYAAYNHGSYHSLIPSAAEHYQLTVTSANNAEALITALQEGKLAIAIMGKGSFTPSGHFIVLRGIDTEGRILVADPVSVERSERSWDVLSILSEARSGAGAGGPIWVISP